jgi:hypothetical protein
LSAINKPASPFEQTAYQKNPKNVGIQKVPAIYKEDEGTQFPVSPINIHFKAQSQTTSSRKDTLSPNYFVSSGETFGSKIKQTVPFDSSNTDYSDRQDNSATNPLQDRQHVKFPDTQTELSHSIKQWETSLEQRSGSSIAKAKHR